MPLYNPPVIIQDEGVTQGVVDTVNFTGAGVTATTSGNVASVAIAGGGGGGTPGGADTQVQYNNAGSFDGAANVEISTQGNLVLNSTETTPNDPGYLGGTVVFSNLIKNFEELAFRRPGLQPVPVQPSFGNTKIGMWTALGNVTTVSTFGMGSAATGTATARAVANTSVATMQRRVGYVSAATAGGSAGVRNSALQFNLGSGTNNGGFIYVTRFQISQVAGATTRWFVGVLNSAAVIGNVNPSTLTNVIGFGIDSGQTTVRLIQNDATVGALTTDLGVNFPATTVNIPYEVTIVSTPVTGKISVQLMRLDNQAVYQDQITTRKPAATTLLDTQLWINNGTTASACAIDVVSQYIETDS